MEQLWLTDFPDEVKTTAVHIFYTLGKIVYDSSALNAVWWERTELNKITLTLYCETARQLGNKERFEQVWYHVRENFNCILFRFIQIHGKMLWLF